MTIAQLTKLFNESVSAAKQIQNEYSGKAEPMPADVEERFTKACDDADTYRKQIEQISRLNEAEKWGNDLTPESKSILDALPGKTAEQKEEKEAFVGFLNGVQKRYFEAVEQTPEVKAYDKFLKFGQKSLQDAEYKALSVGSQADGGFLVMPSQMANFVIDLVKDRLFFRNLATVLPAMTQSESLSIAAFDTDAEDSDWTAEALIGNEEDTVAFGARELRPKPLAKYLKISRKLLRMSAGAAPFVLDRLAYKMARTQEKAFLAGDSANQPLGVFTASTLGISTSRDRSTATANVVTGDDFWNVRDLLHDGYRDRASWIIHPSLETRIRKLKDSNNNYIWQPGVFPTMGISGGIPNTICGMPYNTSYIITDPGYTGNITTGTYVAAVGAWSECYYIVDALNMEMQRLDELFAATNQVGFILRSETDGMPGREEACARMKVS